MTPSIVVWSIVLFLPIAIAWACIGKVDIVGVAPGKIVPAGRTKTVQPLENSVVAAIHVTEGQHVNAGDVLIEFDPTTPTADKARLGKERISLELDSLELDRMRLTKLLETIRGGGALKGNKDPFAEFTHTIEATRLAKAHTRLLQKLAEYRAVAHESAPAAHVSRTWAPHLKPVFKIDIETCEHGGGAVKGVASLDDPAVIKQLLDPRDRRAEPATPAFRPFARAPPPLAWPGLKEPDRELRLFSGLDAKRV